MRARAALTSIVALCASAVVVAGGAPRSQASLQLLGVGATAGDAQRSPTGLIAFSLGPYPHQEIYVVNADGSGLKRLTRNPDADFDPTWSPDGRRIAYRHQRGEDEASEIYVMNADGSQPRNLTRHQGQDHSPAWSPDGKRIAFASARGGEVAIWVMKVDGSRQTRLSRVDGEYPEWSPDGKRIAFDRNRLGSTGWDLWTMDADGSHARPLVASRGQDQGAAWSPDGTTIAFQSDRGSIRAVHYIWLTKANGSWQRRLTSRPGERPAWSRDGARIVFTAGGLFVVREDGSGLTEVRVRAPGEAALSDWTG